MEVVEVKVMEVVEVMKVVEMEVVEMMDMKMVKVMEVVEVMKVVEMEVEVMDMKVVEVVEMEVVEVMEVKMVKVMELVEMMKVKMVELVCEYIYVFTHAYTCALWPCMHAWSCTCIMNQRSSWSGTPDLVETVKSSDGLLSQPGPMRAALSHCEAPWQRC